MSNRSAPLPWKDNAALAVLEVRTHLRMVSMLLEKPGLGRVRTSSVTSSCAACFSLVIWKLTPPRYLSYLDPFVVYKALDGSEPRIVVSIGWTAPWALQHGHVRKVTFEKCRKAHLKGFATSRFPARLLSYPGVRSGHLEVEPGIVRRHPDLVPLVFYYKSIKAACVLD